MLSARNHVSHSDLNPRLAEVEPECQFLACKHVWILCLVERSLKLVQLVRRERRSTSTHLPRLVVIHSSAVHQALLLLRHAAVVVAVATVAMAIVVGLRDVSDVVVAVLLLLTVVVAVVVTSLLLDVSVHLVCVAAPTSAIRYNLQLYTKLLSSPIITQL